MQLVTTQRNQMCYCPGCSHGLLLERLGAALERAGLSRENVCLVSDIGCIGTADRYFTCHTFHGLHGRSFTYAEGIARARPDLTVIVVVGDGGCGIGTAHLVHSARRAAPIKVLVCNNFNFGMTGGQHSPTTPPDGSTTTLPGGPHERPFDICRTVMVNGAPFAARCSAHDEECTDFLAEALRAPGYALVDVWELCSAYYVPANKLSPPRLKELSHQLDMPFGILQRLAAPQRATAGAASDRPRRGPRAAPAGLALSDWPGRKEVCIAGSAGQRVRSAGGVIGEIAVAGGLFAAQQDDFPITVRRGHSISNLVLDRDPILYTGVDAPELTVILSQDGLTRLGRLSHLPPAGLVLADAALELPHTAATIERFDGEALARAAGRNTAALAALVFGLVRCGWIAPARLQEAAAAVIGGEYRDATLHAIAAGCQLAAATNPGVPAAGAASHANT